MADAAKSKDFKSYVADLEGVIEEYMVKKAPGLPENIKEIIVKFTPWITVILMVMLAPVVLGVLGLGSLLMPLSFLGGVGFGVSHVVTLVLTVVLLVMEALALPGLFKRAKSGWTLMFYASLVSIVSGIFSGGILNTIVSTLIGWYFLFQIKSYYK
jgi:hypothetical protein